MIYIVALLLFVTQAFAQAPQPDAACQAWLATPFGQNFSQCEADFPGLPTRTPANNCTLTQQDFDLLCGDACYETMTQAYDFILTNGTCLPLYEYYFGACQSDADCTNPSLGSRVCIEGVCYTSCTTDDDCNSCESEICDTVGQQQACRSNLTVITGNSTFRGNVYQLLSTCSQNDNDGACALLFSNITDMDMSNVSCDTFAGWGCCLGQMLTSMQFCEFERFTATSIYNCAGANQTCADYPTAQQFCLVNVNNTGNGTTNGTSSGISSGISSSLTGGSGHTGSTGVGETGGNSAGTVVISWSLLVGLLLITPALS